jgi:hypothetical protein
MQRCVVVLLVALLCSCGASIRGVTREASKGVADVVGPGDTAKVAREAASGVGEAVAGGLANTETRDAIRETLREEIRYGASAFGRYFTRAFASELTDQLGSDGRGPLSLAVAGAVREMTGAAVEGASSSVSLPCPGGDRAACVEAMVQRLSRSAAAGFTEGVSRRTNWTPLVLTFAGGLLLGLIISAVIVVLRRRKMVIANPPRAPYPPGTPQPA